MRSDHLNKHMKTHNPQMNKKVKEEKSKQQTSSSNKSSANLVKQEIKQEKQDLSPAAMYNTNISSIDQYQTAAAAAAAVAANQLQPLTTSNNELFLPNSHSFAPMLDNNNSLHAGNMGFTMPYYS